MLKKSKNPKIPMSTSKLLFFKEFPQLGATSTKSQATSSKKLLRYMAEKLAQTSSVHGVNQLFSATTGKRERLFWAIVLMLALVMLVYVYHIIGTRYHSKQFQTIVESTRFPIYRIPFPEFTICNKNRLNWARLPQAKQMFLNQTHQREPLESLFIDILARYDSFTYGEFELFGNLSVEVLPLLNYINFTSVVNFMSWRCDELLKHCRWQHDQFNCCDIFFPRTSQLGACLAFNSIESEQGKRMQQVDPKWPWHVGEYGTTSGLTVKVLLREQQHYAENKNDKGLVFMLGEPGVWYNFPMIVAPNTKVRVSINSNVNIYDKSTRSLPPLQRGCVFRDEHHHLLNETLAHHQYMNENCKSECQQRVLVERCNCTMDLFFPPSSYPVCKLSDMPCLANISAAGLQFNRPGEDEYVHMTTPGIKCNCVMNCFSLKYMPEVRSTALRLQQRWTNDSYVEMDLYFRRSFTLAYRTSMVYTWVDLLVSFGGITGLFLGCSFISLVELIYFFLVGMPKFLWRNRRVGAMRVLKVKPKSSK